MKFLNSLSYAKFKYISFLLAVTCLLGFGGLLICAPEKVGAESSDRWSFSDEKHYDVIRLTSDSLNTTAVAAALLPGSANGLTIGSASLPVLKITASNMTVTNITQTLGTNTFTNSTGLRLGYTAVTANTTLTTASSAVVASSNATAVITLQNATTAGAGYYQVVSNIAGSGNVSIASASLISGDASVNATTNTTKEFISNGSTWIMLR